VEQLQTGADPGGGRQDASSHGSTEPKKKGDVGAAGRIWAMWAAALRIKLVRLECGVGIASALSSL